MGHRLGIDIGGTFTDFVLLGDDGQSRLFKVSSNPKNPAAAVKEGLELISADLGLTISTLLEGCDLIIHGTTVVTNALIQGKVAKAGLLCTQGFRDSFEIRLGYKEERYGFLWPPPPMLVPRHLRLAVRERVSKTGEVVVPLDEESVLRNIDQFKRAGVEAVAVSFLWSFLNPTHERRVGELVAAEMPGAFCSLSVDVLPQIREYDRTSTTILNACFGPILTHYIRRIESTFRSLGYSKEIRYVQANAGIASGESLTKRPVFALNSGPAAGPIAGLFFGHQLGHQNIITADMGGTSFDVCLVEGGLADTVKNVDICRYRVGIPTINVNTIGAGGGSIAWLDSGAILRVGPRSAEAWPGPACYGRGGTEPTVTDANVVLGYFSPRALLGGRLSIDRGAAECAIREKIANPLGMDLARASVGIFEVVNNSMASGISEVSISRGRDPRDFVMVVGGGAGGIHAGRLAAALEIPVVLIPKLASAFCAFGAAVAELRHDYVASYTTLLRLADFDRLNFLFNEMERSARAELAREGVAEDEVAVTRWMDLRYVGQLHECTISIRGWRIGAEDVPSIEDSFHREHEALFAYSERGAGELELINLSVTARGPAPFIRPPELAAGPPDPSPALKEKRSVYFPELGGYVATPVYSGQQTLAGNQFVGPAVIEEPTTTVVVFPGARMELDRCGFYVMTLRHSPAGHNARTTEPETWTS